ncbi:uncharacterized protein IWZ02DRAFT_520679 [Phyllosticta citriasiana]|uniref:uncharacterized protein n=1 Tax=Phyllosticta citriasiana TaxID=595635 RepID=UPI0030FD54E6
MLLLLLFSTCLVRGHLFFLLFSSSSRETAWPRHFTPLQPAGLRLRLRLHHIHPNHEHHLRTCKDSAVPRPILIGPVCRIRRSAFRIHRSRFAIRHPIPSIPAGSSLKILRPVEQAQTQTKTQIQIQSPPRLRESSSRAGSTRPGRTVSGDPRFVCTAKKKRKKRGTRTR